MSRNVYFYQACPICGRSLQVRVEYLGRRVFCRHCRGEFFASPVNDQIPEPQQPESHSTIVSSANTLLDPQHPRVWGLPQRTML